MVRYRKKGTTYKRVTDGKKVTINTSNRGGRKGKQLVNRTTVPVGLGFPKKWS